MDHHPRDRTHSSVPNYGFQAFDTLSAFKPHGVVLNIGMSRLDGIETAKRLRATPKGSGITLIPVTAVSYQAGRAPE